MKYLKYFDSSIKAKDQYVVSPGVVAIQDGEISESLCDNVSDGDKLYICINNDTSQHFLRNHTTRIKYTCPDEFTVNINAGCNEYNKDYLTLNITGTSWGWSRVKYYDTTFDDVSYYCYGNTANPSTVKNKVYTLEDEEGIYNNESVYHIFKGAGVIENNSYMYPFTGKTLVYEDNTWYAINTNPTIDFGYIYAVATNVPGTYENSSICAFSSNSGKGIFAFEMFLPYIPSENIIREGTLYYAYKAPELFVQYLGIYYVYSTINTPGTYETFEAFAIQDGALISIGDMGETTITEESYSETILIESSDVDNLRVTSEDFNSKEVYKDSSYITIYKYHPSEVTGEETFVIPAGENATYDISAYVDKFQIYDNTSIKSIEFPKNVYKVSGFTSQKNLQSIKFSEGTIYVAHISDCSVLTKIEFPTSLTSFGGISNTAIKELDLSNTQITSIMYGNYYNCDTLEKVYMPKTLLKMGQDAFYNCPYITIIYNETREYYNDHVSRYVDSFCGEMHFIDNNIEYYANTKYVGENGKITGGLTYTDIEKTKINELLSTTTAKLYFVSEYESSSFEDYYSTCQYKDNITEYIINNNMTQFGVNANYAMIDNITIPTSITYIGKKAFSDATITINYLGTLEQWNNITKEEGWNSNATITLNTK